MSCALLSIQSMPDVHKNVTCDGCQAYPIVGKRYNCLTRDNHDLCGYCYVKETPASSHKYILMDVEKKTTREQPIPLIDQQISGDVVGTTASLVLSQTYE